MAHDGRHQLGGLAHHIGFFQQGVSNGALLSRPLPERFGQHRYALGSRRILSIARACCGLGSSIIRVAECRAMLLLLEMLAFASAMCWVCAPADSAAKTL